MATASLQRVTFGYPDQPPIYQDFDLEIQPGDRWSIIGPSGCGKTTLLYLLAGLRQPTAGLVLVDGAAVLKPRRATGMILQDYGLLPWATALENARLGLRIRGVPAREQRSVAEHWLTRFDLSHVLGQYPAELSGGQRQRVAIARTLALEPDLLLMDEPFNALDALTREELQNLLLALADEQALTTILVTHSIEEAVFLGRRILIFSRPPIKGGVIIENSASGARDYRNDPAFYARCAEVRSIVEAVVLAH